MSLLLKTVSRQARLNKTFDEMFDCPSQLLCYRFLIVVISSPNTRRRFVESQNIVFLQEAVLKSFIFDFVYIICSGVTT